MKKLPESKAECPCPDCGRWIQSFKKTSGSWEKRVRGQMVQHLKTHGYRGRAASVKADDAMVYIQLHDE